MNPWVWAIAALVVALMELHAPGYYLIWIGIGLAVTGAGEAIRPAPLEAQLVTFIAATSLSCIFGFYAYRSITSRSAKPRLNQRNIGMIGAKGTVCDVFSNGRGKVRLGDSVWLAEGPDLPIGAPIVVRDVQNTVVIVDLAANH